MIRFALAAPLALLPFAAQAQQASPGRTFSLPAGCTAYLTVQEESCTVSHHFTCENDPAGWQRRVTMDESGISYFGAIDAETQWVESFHMISGHSERLAPGATDPASFTDLTTTGVDTYDFQTDSAEVGTTRYVGQDRLTGETVTIDGVTLDQTEFAITAYASDGTEMWTSHGREFISRDWRMFLSGTSTITAGGETWESSERPVDFIFPGEPGFLSVTPVHGCGVVLSSIDAGAAPPLLRVPG